LVLDRPLLEATGIDADAPLEVPADDDSIVVFPVRDPHCAARFRAAVRRDQPALLRYPSPPGRAE